MCFQYWNQLSRFQRNIIFTLVAVSIVTTLVLLNSENVIAENSKEINHLGVNSFKDEVKQQKNYLNSFFLNNLKNFFVSSMKKKFPQILKQIK